MDKKTIESLLGGKITEMVYSTRRGTYPGWISKVKSNYADIKRIDKIWAKFSKENVRLFTGTIELDSDAYYNSDMIIPNMPVLEIVDLCKIGIHNNSGDYWETIYQALEEIYVKHPFEIQFADSAGMWATFLNRVPKASAAKIELTIAEIDPEAPEAIDERSISELILQENRLRLWWD